MTARSDPPGGEPASGFEDPRLDTETPLRPGNAEAAIIVVRGRYLLQLRDMKRGIFFPGHWGCFGGGVERGESPDEALLRELDEELGLRPARADVVLFTRFEFGLGFNGLAPVWRSFYELELAEDDAARLDFAEGSGMRLCPREAILAATIPLTPYDAFALWLHINRRRLAGRD